MRRDRFWSTPPIQFSISAKFDIAVSLRDSTPLFFRFLRTLATIFAATGCTFIQAAISAAGFPGQSA